MKKEKEAFDDRHTRHYAMALDMQCMTFLFVEDLRRSGQCKDSLC